MSYDGLDLTKARVGDELLIQLSDGHGRYRTNGPLRLTVEKVGRSLVTVEHFARPWKFRIEDGTEVRPANAGGTGSRAFTVEGWDHRERKTAATQRINQFVKDEMRRASVDTLESIVKAIDEIEPT